MGWIKRVNSFTLSFAKLMVMITLGAMCIAVILAVCSRTLLHNSLTWAEEAIRFLQFWVIGFGSVIAFKRGEHVGMDFFVNLLPENQRRWVKAVAYGSICFFLFYFFLASFTVSLNNMNQYSPVLRVPMGSMYLSLSVGCVMMFLYCFESVIALFVEPDSIQLK